jgi:hypothetical protein
MPIISHSKLGMCLGGVNSITLVLGTDKLVRAQETDSTIFFIDYEELLLELKKLTLGKRFELY